MGVIGLMGCLKDSGGTLLSCGGIVVAISRGVDMLGVMHAPWRACKVKGTVARSWSAGGHGKVWAVRAGVCRRKEYYHTLVFRGTYIQGGIKSDILFEGYAEWTV